jgi:hypothetical protein
MVTKSSLMQPLRPAVWLVNLFAPFEQSKSVLGDLLEEFSDLASKFGVASARRWFWRQSVKSVAQLIRSAFPGAPWLTAIPVVGGYQLSFRGGRNWSALIAGRRLPLKALKSEVVSHWNFAGIKS